MTRLIPAFLVPSSVRITRPVASAIVILTSPGCRRRQVVVDRRAARRVLADEHLLAADLLAALPIVEVGDRRTDVEEHRVLRRRRRELLQRRDVVGDPDAAPVRRDDQVVVARMDQDVVDARRRKVVHELLPLLAAVERDEQPELGADVEQVPVLRILAHDLDVAERRQVAGDARPTSVP